MLPTCTRCRNRRIKCDSLLPACANCSKHDVECTFRDEALQADVTRGYLKTLQDRIEKLNSELALNTQISSSGLTERSPDGMLTRPSLVSSFILMPKSGRDMYLDLSLSSRLVEVTLEVLSQHHKTNDWRTIDKESDPLPDIPHLDRSMLTPGVVRGLLKDYHRFVRPKYDIVELDILSHDGIHLRKLPEMRRFQILMACSISAAQKTYKSPNWKPFAHTCREWANDFIAPIICAADADSMKAILLLLVYELADPTRGIIWELLDVARRTCLQLGWNRTASNSNDFTGNEESVSADPVRTHLMCVLREIEGSLRTVSNRPILLIEDMSYCAPEKDISSILYNKLFHATYGTSRIGDAESCPFVGEVSGLLDRADVIADASPASQEIWLVLLATCVRHKQCVACYQEPDDQQGKGMRTLRHV
ncbi:transcriptional regulator family: Fungal Specific TF [Aspergillus niger]|nr:transcriptional regulator family: Fungal Specific TF [Aspergillus niger]